MYKNPLVRVDMALEEYCRIRVKWFGLCKLEQIECFGETGLNGSSPLL